ncbi:beta-aspartyl-dipeptidase (metallo-type) [Anaerobacterium chartisolvens]|uniref:Isoaspartyl dipeptidase n=1 Tax=Anaerobacterium chartisolvens TaxID=1297424 RepID=A0A369B2X3_9FIRM|nr:beta-aspartyl-peptidase [Anaerobacterium chartisolvens]RCX14796.1 beta-aspartyl-dipeptidase (metallo-type) [Anaerobacterium chartisolvens]
MFKLLKSGECFTPEYIGKKDLLVCNGKICRIDDTISYNGLWDVEIIDCEGRLLCPGFIDQHVHITGGGGEQGPESRIPPLMLGDILSAGVSTVVGILGADGLTRGIADLLYKARALEAEGITAYIYTGSYGVPPATLTGRVISDIAFIDKIIGVGEIAISDSRASHCPISSLKELAYEANTGGMLGGKAGVMHIHVGDGREGLKPLFELVDKSDFPIEMFVPTHLNRNKGLLEQAKGYGSLGGNLDLTAGESSQTGYSVPDALEILLECGINADRITVSSDGNGSIPGGGIGKVGQLLQDITSCVLDKKINFETVLKTVTSNVARILKLYPQKGALSAGSDADILVLDKHDLTIRHMLVKGDICILDGKIIKRGKYEPQ